MADAAALETAVRKFEDAIADLERIISKWYDPLTTQELRVCHDALFSAHGEMCELLGIAPVAVPDAAAAADGEATL